MDLRKEKKLRDGRTLLIVSDEKEIQEADSGKTILVTRHNIKCRLANNGPMLMLLSRDYKNRDKFEETPLYCEDCVAKLIYMLDKRCDPLWWSTKSLEMRNENDHKLRGWLLEHILDDTKAIDKKNRDACDELKKIGLVTEGEWVIMVDGGIKEICDNKIEALSSIEKLKHSCSLIHVGHEDEVLEV